MIAERLAAALHGRRTGALWMARCPAHDDRTPSLSIQDAEDGRVLVHCHAGCEQAQVIAALRSQGLWGKNGRDHHGPLIRRGPPSHRGIRSDLDAQKRTEVALMISREAAPATSTPVETYLHSRGINITLPHTVRFHAGLRHPSGDIWPAMVALVTGGMDNKALGIHRTFLSSDGTGKAPVAPQKMMLGPCRGGAVRLARCRDVLMVGEGIETCLAAMQATERPAWAALSTSGLRTLDLPDDVRDVIVLADGDEAGEAAAREAALRWKHEGRRARIARPPQGLDFNDLLLGRTPHVEEGVA